ncbi:MAG: 30S ribosomal protein S4 [Candidatus Paceibacterota bacterium]
MKIGPKYKICRRLGDRVFSKCQTTKFTVSGTNRKRTGKRRQTVSEFGQQLLEKQKVRYTYGVSEKQFGNYVKAVKKNQKRENNPATEFYQALESRLDNVVFRAGLVNSRIFARQLVSHGHVMVNGRRMTVPSHRLRIGDKFSIRPQSKDKGMFAFFTENQKNYQLPQWLSFDEKSLAGEIKGLPVLSDDPAALNFKAILEFYSRV